MLRCRLVSDASSHPLDSRFRRKVHLLDGDLEDDSGHVVVVRIATVPGVRTSFDRKRRRTEGLHQTITNTVVDVEGEGATAVRHLEGNGSCVPVLRNALCLGKSPLHGVVPVTHFDLLSDRGVMMLSTNTCIGLADNICCELATSYRTLDHSIYY